MRVKNAAECSSYQLIQDVFDSVEIRKRKANFCILIHLFVIFIFRDTLYLRQKNFSLHLLQEEEWNHAQSKDPKKLSQKNLDARVRSTPTKTRYQ